MSRHVITVDGLAGSGKSTLARALADRLGFIHLNTGLLYRAVAYAALSAEVDPMDSAALQNLLSKHQISLDIGRDGAPALKLDGRDITREVQEPHVSEATSKAAQHRVVREFLRESQRTAFLPHPIVAEGRDLGTVIFPEAKLKLFVHADESVRIARRLKQLGIINAHEHSVADKIRIEILERDKRDAERALSPTVAAPDAEHIDNSHEPVAIIVERLYVLAKNRGMCA
jgi:cytidylate kinase